MRKTLRIVAVVAVVVAVASFAGARLGSYFGGRGAVEGAADGDPEAQKRDEDAMRRLILHKQEDSYRRMKESGASAPILRRMARQNAGLWREHGDEATAQKWEELAKQ
jgi:hypothetical protein